MTDINLDEVVEVPKQGKKNIILDSQVLTALMKCGRLTDFQFNMNLVSIGGKSNSLECGSLVHVFLEYYYKSIINRIDPDRARGFALAAAETYIQGCKGCMDFTPTPEQPKPSCNHKPNEFPGLKNTPKDSENYKTGWQWVLDTCDQYCLHYRNDFWVPLEVEIVKAAVLYEDDEIRVMWKAKLDWIVDTNQGIYPVDHKTMKQKRDTLSLNNQFMGQCLIMGTRNVIINKIGFQTSLKPVDKFIRVPISYSASRLFEWQSETLPYYAKLLLMYHETGHFPPNYSNCDGKYGNCPFVRVCESDPGMREEELKHGFIVGQVWNPTNEDE